VVGGRLLALWCVPRSRSTVFLRMMAERGDLTVVHEPFSRVGFHGGVDVGGRPCASEAEVLDALLDLAGSGPVFFKETTDYRYPGVLDDPSFLRACTHAVMVRSPEAVVASYLRLHPDASLGAMGFEHLSELDDAVAVATGQRPFLLDGDELAAAPAAVVAAYCDAIGLPFLPDALQWEAGAMDDWGQFSRWHEAAAASTGFVESTSEPVPDDLRERAAAYVAHHAPFYERLRSARRSTPT
jgi:hypothetical protein